MEDGDLDHLFVDGDVRIGAEVRPVEVSVRRNSRTSLLLLLLRQMLRPRLPVTKAAAVSPAPTDFSRPLNPPRRERRGEVLVGHHLDDRCKRNAGRGNGIVA